MRKAGLALLSFLVAGCGSATRPPEPRHSDPTGFTLVDGEIQLELTLYQVDLVDAKIRRFRDAPGDPIATCANTNKDVMAKKLAFKPILGKPRVQDKAAEISYYDLLAEGSPAELVPVVHLMKYYKEGLLRCLLDSTNGKAHGPTEESNISILTALNFDAETSNGIVIVDFMTHWCGPCKEMVPELEKLAQDYKGKVKIGRLDVDRNRIISKRFDTKLFPTLILLKDGKEINRMEVASSYTELRKWTQDALKGEISSPSGKVLGGEQSAPLD